MNGGGLREGGKASALDVRLRAVLVLLEPPLTLACILGVPMADVVHFTKNAYVRVGLRRGHSIRGLAARYDAAPATIQSFKAAARDSELAVALGVRMTRHREIVALLTRRGATRIQEVIGAQPSERPAVVLDALQSLVDAGIVHREGEVVRLHDAALLEQGAQAAGDDEGRLDGLRVFLEAVTELVHRRFFAASPAPVGEAFARAIRFGVRRGELAAIRTELFESIRARVVAADAELPDGSADKGTATLLFALSEDTMPAARTRGRSA